MERLTNGTCSIEAGVSLWGGKDNILSLVVERIRRYKPEVIVTQDLDGEYGHNQHKITARCAKYAIDAAADPAQYPESAQKYGAWQVKKLYHHLYKENALEMNWEIPLDSLGGKTALQVAKLGMKEHSSQTDAFVVKSHGTYDNAKFGLYFTTVGEDVAKDDFLEHIDPDASANYLAEHAAEIEAQKAETAAELAAAAENARALPEEAPEEEAPEEEAPEEEAPVEEAGEDADGTFADGSDAGEAPEDTARDAATGGTEEAGNDAAGEANDAATEAASEAPDGSDGNAVPGQPGVQAAGQPLGTAAPAVAEERNGNTLLPVLMIGAGVAAIGVGGWYGWRYMQGQKRRRRRRR